MRGSSLAIGRGAKCSVAGCERAPGLFGACIEHQDIPVSREFDAAVQRGAASEQMPPCFESNGAWKEYVACWSLKERITSRYSKHVEYCRDCSPSYKARMDSSGRCSKRETIFVRKDSGETVGISSHFVSRWESSLLGLHGEIVMLPPQDAIEATEQRIANARAPKKMGRPRKASQ